MSQLPSTSSSYQAPQNAVYQMLNAFFPSSDEQLNELFPPKLSTSGRLTSILDHGILSRAAMEEKGLTYEGGYDLGSNDVVFINSVTTEDGVIHAVFSAADGVFGVGVEREGDNEWIHSICENEAVDKIFHEKISGSVPEIFYPIVKEKALQEHLQENEEFLGTIETRAYNLAVLVLDLPPKESDSLDNPQGCHDAVRPSISAENIVAIIVSKDLKDASEIINVIVNRIKPVIFVESKQEKITYTYEKSSPSGAVQKEHFKLSIVAPSFEDGILQIYQSSFLPQQKPMYLHAARI